MFDAQEFRNLDTSRDDDDNPPAPGTYEAVLVEGSAFTSQAGKPYLKLRWRLVGDPLSLWTELYGLDRLGGKKAAKATLERMQVNLDAVTDFDSLGSVVAQAVDQFFTVTVKQNGQYRNTYVEGPSAPDAGVTDPGDFPVPAPANASDDVPF